MKKNRIDPGFCFPSFSAVSLNGDPTIARRNWKNPIRETLRRKNVNFEPIAIKNPVTYLHI
jgi:hypothetical protein